MSLFVVNCGSSTVKYRLYSGSTVIHSGLQETTDHEKTLHEIFDSLDLSGLTAIGHRVVHGGTRFTEPTLINDAVVTAIQDLVPLAPLHNPVNLAGISAARARRPDVPQVAVFDTAFHRTLPPHVASYAIDVSVATRYDVQRYGFHGTSHCYVSRRTAELLGRPVEQTNVITLHLGNGASACAVQGGRSVATSMGLSPLAGLVMGTRSGDIDPAVVFHLHRAGMTMDEIDDLLNRHSGLLGLCGDSDMRRVLARRAAGDPAAEFAFAAYCQRIREFVGAYYATLGRVDAITFTAGVGENAAEVRAAALAGLNRLGVSVDDDRNLAPSRQARLISGDGAEVAVYVVPTDEELEIATQTASVIDRPG
jgi:acetate kinase